MKRDFDSLTQTRAIEYWNDRLDDEGESFESLWSSSQ